MAKKKQFVTAAAAFAVAASAVTPAITADAATKTVRLSSDFVRAGNLDAALDKSYNGGEIHWYKSSVDMNKLGVFQTAKGFVKGQGLKVEKRVRVLNYAQDIQPEGEIVLEQGVPASGLRVQPVLFADGNHYAKPVAVAGFNTDKVGEFEGTFTYANKAFGTVTKTVKYKVVATKVELSNVTSSVDQAAEVLSVNADVKNLKEGEKVELVVFAGRDVNAPLAPVQAEVKDGKVSVKSAKLPAGNHSFILRSGDVKTEAANFVVESPEVKEVKAINATEAQITFNKPVLESVAETAANYTFTSVAPAASATLAIEDIQLQADGKTAIVRFTSSVEAASTAQLEGASYKVTTQNLLTADYKKVADYTGEYKFSDKTAPALKGAMINGNNLELAFDEEVNFSTAILRVDGQQVTVTGATLVADEAGKYVYEVAVSGNPVAEGSHSVTLVSLKDLAGNEAGTLTSSYVVAKDLIAPTVKAIEAVSSDTFKVKLSENVQSSPTIKVMKGSIQYTATRVGADSVASEYTYKVDLDTDASTTGSADGTGANPLYGTNDSSVALSVEVSNYKDAVNLVGTTYTGIVTLSKDKTAPALLNQALNTIAAGVGPTTVITVPFTETLVTDANTNSKVKVINPDGVELAATVTKVAGSKGVDTALQVVANGAPIAGNYQVVFASGAVKDVDNNLNAAFTTSVKYDASQQYVSFDTVADANGTGSVSVLSKNVIAVDFNEEVGTSALNVANYKLDNAALPAGTTAVFTSAAKDVVELRLPSTFKVVADAAYKFEISKDVKTAAGSMIVADHTASTKSNYTTTVTLLDNVAPELKTAVLKNSGAAATTNANEIELTFSEALAATTASATLNDDFIVKVNGVVTTATVTDTVSTDNKLVLTLAGDINAAQTVTVQVASSNIEVADARANLLVSGTAVTATK